MTKESTLVPDRLLAEMGQFVDDTLAKETLSTFASSQRQSLIQRLSLYIPDPAALPSYLDMNAGAAKGVNVVLTSPIDRGEYIDADNLPPEVTEEQYECPDTAHMQVPAKPETEPKVEEQVNVPESNDYSPMTAVELKQMATKCGPLLRKERRFFVEQLRRYWAGINNVHLFFYINEKEAKPISVIDLRGFQARAMPVMMKVKEKKRDACFEVVCPGKKTIKLVARTAKDMHQWVSIINEAGRQPAPPTKLPSRSRRLPSIPDSDSSETYDDIASVNSPFQHQNPLMVDDDDIYHDISIASNGYNSDQESLYDDIVQNNPNNIHYNPPINSAQSNQPLEGNADVITEKPEIQQLPVEEEEEEEDIYDDIGVQSKLAKVIVSANKTKPSKVATRTVMSSDRNGNRIQELKLLLESNLQITSRKVPIQIPQEEEYEQVDIPQK